MKLNITPTSKLFDKRPEEISVEEYIDMIN